MMKTARTIALLLVLVSTPLCSADWLGFRGSNSDGVAVGDGPTKCDESNVAWSAKLPGRGVSSPVVVGDQVVITASSGPAHERLHVLSIDVANGKQRWHRQFWATGRTITHPTSANAAPTPVSDGKHIVAFFSSNDVICLGLDGELCWYRGLGHDYPKAGNDIGMASSPVLADGVVVCQAENQGDSFVEGIDVTNGTTLWRLERPTKSNWTSPVHLPGDSHQVLLKSDEAVSSHDIHTGEPVWQIDGELGGVPSMVVSGGLVYVPGGTFTVIAPEPDSATIAWDSQTISAATSPIVHDGRIYTISGSVGIMNCLDAETGGSIWKTRVAGKYWASPVLAGNSLYLANQKGELHILDRDTGKKVDSHDFGEELMGTPAVSDGALFVRSTETLWKVARP